MHGTYLADVGKTYISLSNIHCSVVEPLLCV
jgi:hypothetical protein